MKRIKQAEKQRIRIAEIRQEYCKFFEITEEQYSNNEFEQGLLWIEVNKQSKGFAYTPTFWNWWKMEMADIAECCTQKKEIVKIYLNDIRPLLTTLKQIENESQLNAPQEIVLPVQRKRAYRKSPRDCV